MAAQGFDHLLKLLLVAFLAFFRSIPAARLTPRLFLDSLVSTSLRSVTLVLAKRFVSLTRTIRPNPCISSCLLLAFVTDEFDEDTRSTIGVDLKVKLMPVADKTCKLTIWDTGCVFHQRQLIFVVGCIFHCIASIL
jgi:hypothetical protein